MALHAKDTGHVVQLLGHVLPNASHLAAALASGGIGLVADIGAWQAGRQCLALGLRAISRGGDWFAELLHLLGNGGQVCINLVFEQVAL